MELHIRYDYFIAAVFVVNVALEAISAASDLCKLRIVSKTR